MSDLQDIKRNKVGVDAYNVIFAQSNVIEVQRKIISALKELNVESDKIQELKKEIDLAYTSLNYFQDELAKALSSIN